MKKTAILFFYLVFLLQLYAQQGGNNVFAFLNLPTGARSAALGGHSSATADQTLDFAIANPSLANEQMVGHFSLQQSLLPAGVTYGNLVTALPLKRGCCFLTFVTSPMENFRGMMRWEMQPRLFRLLISTRVPPIPLS